MNHESPLTPIRPISRLRRGGTPLALLRLVVYLVLAGTVGVAAFEGYQTLMARAALTQNQKTVVIGMGLVEPMHKHLAAEYTDKDGRLLADPPTNSADLIDPSTLVLAYTEGSDTEDQAVDWKALSASVEKATGKKVELQAYENSVDDVAAVKAGKIQIVALHAADTPYVVNNAGFIPVGVLGGKAGPTGNKLDIAVPVSSSIQKIGDLKGHTLTCTTPSSITGYRAAVALLMLDANLRPNVDYLVSFSLKQKNSIHGIRKGQFEAAALSDDKVQSQTADGKLAATDYRTIYQSEVIPRLTIGYVYNLKPELAAKIQQAVLSFDNANGAVDEDGDEPMHFAPVDYKKDFDLVRKIDDAFDPRFNSAIAGKAKKAANSPTTAPSAT